MLSLFNGHATMYGKLPSVLAIMLLPCLMFCFFYDASASPVSVFVPSKAIIPPSEKKDPGQTKPVAKMDPREVDILFSMMDAYEQTAMNMDMPQMFASLRYSPGMDKPERVDLLGDMEEIRYLDKVAWGANVALEKPGLYQFIMEGRPWWDAKNDVYIQHQAKVLLPVEDMETGWHLPAGQALEILPLSRPFGLASPAIFSGIVIKDGKPCANVPVYMGLMNTNQLKVPSIWHKKIEARSNVNGQFSFLLNQPGWWYCEATVNGDPLKGPDGQIKPVLRSALLWLYVDPPLEEKNARK